MNNSEKGIPSDELIYSLLEHYQNGRLSDAEKLALEITRDFPLHEFAWKVLGVIFEVQGRKSEALNANQTAVKLSPQDAEAHNNLGNTLKELERLDEAECSYKQAIDLSPNYAEAHCNLGIVLHALGKLDKAEASYKQAASLKPDFPEAYGNLGITLQEAGRFNEAETSYKQAIELSPNYAEAHSNLGNTLKELGRLEDAEASYKKAIALEPNFAEAHNNLGATLQGLGRLGEAETSLNQAIALSPQDAEAFNNLGNILKELGRLDEAQTSYKQALVLKPNFVDGARNLVQLPVGKLDSNTLNLCEKAFDVLDDSPEQQIKYLFFRGGLLKHQGFIEQSFNIFCKANQLKSEISKDKMVVEAKKYIDSLKRIDSWVPSFPKLIKKRLAKLFIMGPSKSGKSSVEHILSKSSSVKTLHETIKHSELLENARPAKSSNELIFENLFSQSEFTLFDEGYKIVTSTNPASIFYSDYLIDLLPSAYFIFVKRDLRDISPEIFTSEYNMENFYSYDVNEIKKYLDVYYMACETLALKVPNRCLSVSFEDIIQAPENVVDQISEKIGCDLQVSNLKRKVANFEYESLFRNHYATLRS